MGRHCHVDGYFKGKLDLLFASCLSACLSVCRLSVSVFGILASGRRLWRLLDYLDPRATVTSTLSSELPRPTTALWQHRVIEPTTLPGLGQISRSECPYRALSPDRFPSGGCRWTYRFPRSSSVLTAVLGRTPRRSTRSKPLPKP
jgi:hypothetical protein